MDPNKHIFPRVVEPYNSSQNMPDIEPLKGPCINEYLEHMVKLLESIEMNVKEINEKLK